MSKGTQHRSVRVSDTDWAAFADAAIRQGLDRAKVINQFIAWYLHRPGAELPKRPDAHRSDADNPSTSSNTEQSSADVA